MDPYLAQIVAETRLHISAERRIEGTAGIGVGCGLIGLSGSCWLYEQLRYMLVADAALQIHYLSQR